VSHRLRVKHRFRGFIAEILIPLATFRPFLTPPGCSSHARENLFCRRFGVDAYEVEIEVNGAQGDPKIIMVGVNPPFDERLLRCAKHELRTEHNAASRARNDKPSRWSGHR
jgi:hypothetical protein